MSSSGRCSSWSSQCLVAPRRIAVLARIGLMTALLAAVRLAPAVVTYGGGSNIFVSGYPSRLAACSPRSWQRRYANDLLDPWELDAYVGYAGFLLLCLGIIPFRQSAKRFLNVLLLPTAALIHPFRGRCLRTDVVQVAGLCFRARHVAIHHPADSVAHACGRRPDRRLVAPRGTIARESIARLAWQCGFWPCSWCCARTVWRPHAGTTLNGLPVAVLKASRGRAVRICGRSGAAPRVSAASAFVVARVLLKREGNSAAQTCVM